MKQSSSSPLPGLEDHLGYWLRFVSNHVSTAFARALEDVHFTVAEWVALRQLYDHPDITAAELAERLGMTRGAVSKVLDKLESKHMVERLTRPEDKRSHVLSLTVTGRQTLPELAEIADRNDMRYFDCLSLSERTTLSQLLQNVAQKHKWHELPVD